MFESNALVIARALFSPFSAVCLTAKGNLTARQECCQDGCKWEEMFALQEISSMQRLHQLATVVSTATPLGLCDDLGWSVLLQGLFGEVTCFNPRQGLEAGGT